ncbi:MAG: hypothetical protein MSG78_04120 [Clostridiales bacterium]|nr:hypothetical protein [Clostridiales bacterium]
MLENGKKYTFNTIDTELSKYNGTDVEVIRPLTETECDIEDVGNMYKVRFSDGYERDAFEDELSENKYYELMYFYGRKDSGSIFIKTTLDMDLYYEDEFLQKLVERNELALEYIDAITDVDEIDEETYHDMTGK